MPAQYLVALLQQFRTISEALCLRHLQFLDIDCVDCSEEDLARLVLNHKDTLKKVSFSDVNIIAGGGSWQSLVRTIRDQLSIENLAIISCQVDDILIGILKGDGIIFLSN